MYLHTKSTYFHFAVSSRIRFHLPVAAYQPCSTHGAPQHSSILHREIPLRFREPGRARSTCRRFTSSFPFASNRISPCSSLGASQHSSILQCEIPLRFRERGLPAPAREPNRPILILTSRLEINSVCEWPGNAMYLAPSPTTFLYSPFQNSSSFPRTRPPRPQLARPGSRKRRGISRWGIDQCCEAPRVEHCDIRR